MYSDYITPCYIFDEDDFKNNIVSFQKVMKKYFGEKGILGYSFKTNFLPYILNIAKDNGAYAEVVSEKEYNLAKALGYEQNFIIYNGPVKTRESFLEAVRSGCIVNIDSKREIEWLESLPSEYNYKVGIRVNFDLEDELPGQTIMAKEGGRFGFCDDNDELIHAIRKIKNINNVSINCLHMHVSSKSKSLDIYKHLLYRACNIIKRENLSIDFIDIGGSFFGGGDNGQAYEKYITEIKNILISNNQHEIGLIVEPGASVISTSVKYLTEVVDIKQTTKNRFVVVDGSRLHVDPFFVRSNYSYNLISSNNTKLIESQVISGFTCMEKDRIMKLEKTFELCPGDRILINTVGSYTMCMNSDFISPEPRVYLQANHDGNLIRTEKSIEQYLINNKVR